MINAKRANALLWTGNVLLIIGIVAFAFQYLIFPELKTRENEAPVTVPPYTQPNDPTDTSALGKLPNPLVPAKPPPTEGPRGPVRLIGTDRILDDPTGDTAYLELPARKLNVNAYLGEPVRDDSTGVEVPECAGWRLKGVTPKSATFSTKDGPDLTLQIEEFVAAPPSMTGAGGAISATLPGLPWESSKFASKKDTARSNDTQEMWNIDRKEIDWAAANVDMILRDVHLEPYPGGGLKIITLPEGGFASERGFRAGDVIRSVNSQPVESIQKLTEVMKGLSKNARTLSVQVDRSGRLYTITYSVPAAPRQ